MIKKFDFDKQEYLPCEDYETYEYGEGFYEVKDSCFVVEQMAEETKDYVPNAVELTLMEAQAELYEEQQFNNLTLMETMAEIYETILGGE